MAVFESMFQTLLFRVQKFEVLSQSDKKIQYFFEKC